MQHLVKNKKTTCRDSLKLAIRQAASEIPLQMLKKAVLSFYKRICLCIQKEGGTFKDQKFEGEMPLVLESDDEDHADI